MEARTINKKRSKISTLNSGDDRVKLDLLSRVLRVREEVTETPARLETAIDRIGKVATNDAHPPVAVAEKTESVGVIKAKLNTLSTILLGILAGVFIGLGAMFYTIVTMDTGLGFGLIKLVGGPVFCLGLVLVVVAGAELFTGNSLILMSWMSGRTPFTHLLRNWRLVYFANLLGALSLAGLIFYTNQWAFSSYGVGANALLIANAKVNLTFSSALARGILCNVFVCLAVWLCSKCSYCYR